MHLVIDDHVVLDNRVIQCPAINGTARTDLNSVTNFYTA